MIRNPPRSQLMGLTILAFTVGLSLLVSCSDNDGDEESFEDTATRLCESHQQCDPVDFDLYYADIQSCLLPKLNDYDHYEQLDASCHESYINLTRCLSLRTCAEWGSATVCASEVNEFNAHCP